MKKKKKFIFTLNNNLNLFTRYSALILIVLLSIQNVHSQELTSEQKKKIEQYKKTLQVNLQQNQTGEIIEWYSKIAYSYWNAGLYQEAEKNFSQALKHLTQLGNKNGLKTIHYNLGLIAIDRKNYTDALEQFNQGIQIARDLGQKTGILNGYINKASAYQSLSQHQNAIETIEKALPIARELDNIKLLRTCYGFLAENYEALGNAEKSMSYFNQYAVLDKHIKAQKVKQIESTSEQKVKQFRREKKQSVEELAEKDQKLKITKDSLQISKRLAHEQQLELKLQKLSLLRKEDQLRNERLIRYGLIGIAALILLSLILILKQYKAKKRANKKLEKQNEQIKEQKQNITDSIEYASRIQQALLPPDHLLKSIFPEYFILFKPRDLVSGDFYWMNRKDQRLILAAADCTGHGVPGAFMSMLGIAFLNEIVNKFIENKHIYTLQASEVLNNLRKYIIESLHQKEGTTGSKDGIDMAIAIIDFEHSTIQFAGAYNPLFLIRNGELIEKKPDRMPVSIHRRAPQSFTNHEFKFQDNDIIYMFSDGFHDQLGGEKGRKFMSKKFKELLLNIHHEPMEKQKEILNQKFLEWKKGYDQLDDILVIGARLLQTTRTKTKPEETKLPWKDHTILIVEDTELNYLYLTEALKKTQVNMIRAENGEEAIDIVKERDDINLILMDIDMPRMDGFECTREIRKIKPEIPIVAQTAHSIDDLEEKTQQAGCDDFYTKPIQLKELLNMVEKHLKK